MEDDHFGVLLDRELGLQESEAEEIDVASALRRRDESIGLGLHLVVDFAEGGLAVIVAGGLVRLMLSDIQHVVREVEQLEPIPL